MAPRDGRSRKQKEADAERYRRAAELALEQLEWCIGYLRQIRKQGIARVLDENRKAIASRLRR